VVGVSTKEYSLSRTLVEEDDAHVEREYKGWCIDVRSYSSGHQWRPIVIVSSEIDGRREITNLRTPSDWLFNTKQESDEQGHHLGSTWIDRHGFGPEGK
jgi:hypothetical protein